MTEIKDWLKIFEHRLNKDIICERIEGCSGSVDEIHFIAHCMDQIGKTMCGFYRETLSPSEWLFKVHALCGLGESAKDG